MLAELTRYIEGKVMDKEQQITDNIKVPNKNLEVLKKYFSHCFDQTGQFDFEKFKQELSENELDFYKESYGLDWLGKSYARILASESTTTLLKENEEFNRNENKNSQNLLIKGDNLEVLKHLSNAYYEKIKMIYIDPPYNTGSDGFVYQDDRKFSVKELQQLAGIDEEKAKRILNFTQSKSNSHSAWLTFMYPRLYIAKQLLREDGVIFVSIDDNEVAQLRILMDEIFGEENFIANFVWKNKNGGGNDSKFVAVENENILFYAKSTNSLNNLFHQYNFEYQKRYKEKDAKGLFYWDTFKRKSGKQYYKIVCPDGTLLEKDKYRNPISWLRSEKTFKNDLKNGEIRIIKISGQWSVHFKQRMPKGKKPRSILDSYGTTSVGSDECLNLFGKNIFENPKPTSLIKHLLDIITCSSSIILDFFAGSGTTGDAVMQLNTDDDGNRKYILVQLAEEIDPKKNKVAYDFVKDELGIEKPTIFEITKERLIRAAKKINDELDEKAQNFKLKIKDLEEQLPTDETKAEIEKLRQQITKNLELKTQNCFKIFKTMPIWEDYNFEADELTPELELFDESRFTEDDIKALLVTWKTYDGLSLTEDLQELDLSGYRSYYSNEKLYLMHKGFKTDNLKALLEKIDSDINFNPTSIIAFGYHFESKSLREIAENIKTYANKKHIDIDFITRY